MIIIDSYFLIADWARDYEGYIGIFSFYLLQSGGVAVWFFSGLTAGIFLVIFGIILGLRVRSRWAITSIAGGSVLLFLSSCLIVMDVITTAAIDPVFGLRAFRRYFFWENFTPVIPISLMFGGILVVLGVLLVRKSQIIT